MKKVYAVFEGERAIIWETLQSNTMHYKDTIPPRCTGAGKSQICEYRDQCARYQRYKNERRIVALSIMSKPKGVCDVFQRRV